MIRFLKIHDLAVAEQIELELDNGFNVLTGETGAGKSVVVGAFGLLRGGRATSGLVRTGAEKAVVEAMIVTPGGKERILRREVSATGRSRAFVDNTLVSISSLRELVSKQLDLYGQHEHQTLLEPTSHLDLLDQYANLQTIRDEVQSLFANWRQAVDELALVTKRTITREERAEVVAFQLREIEDVNPVEGEDEALTVKQQILTNADRLHRLAAESYTELYDGDGAVLEVLERVWKRVAELAALDPIFSEHLDGRSATTSQLEELAFTLRTYVNSIDTSPEQLQVVEDRLAKLAHLKRRFGPNISEVLVRQERLRAEGIQLKDDTEIEKKLHEKILLHRESYLGGATTLSKSRQTYAPKLARTLEENLTTLAMGRSRFEVVFSQTISDEKHWTERGFDDAEFYFSANPGEELRPLVKIASGGELSRLMLALRTTIGVSRTTGGTLVFDEVDAGIGGEAAERVGARLRGLANENQVVCVTHLPHIAVYGTSHHRVTKAIHNGRTVTKVELLTGSDRISEVARMMTGTLISDKVLESARELLEKSEYKANL